MPDPRPHTTGYVLGPVTGDHWFVYVADKCDRPDYTATDRTVRDECLTRLSAEDTSE